MVIMSEQTRFVGILSLFDEEGDETLEEISSELRKMFMTKQRLKQLSMPSLQDLYLDLPAMKFRIKSFILWRSLSFVVTLSWFLSCYCSSYFLVSSIWMEVCVQLEIRNLEQWNMDKKYPWTFAVPRIKQAWQHAITLDMMWLQLSYDHDHAD